MIKLQLHRSFLVIVGFVALSMGNSTFSYSQPGMTPPGSVAPQPPTAPSAPSAPNSPPPPPAASPAWQPPPPPPRSNVRSGWHGGFGLGAGSMDSDNGSITCDRCPDDPVAVGFDLHIGKLLSPDLSLQAEVWLQDQRANQEGTISYRQTSYVLALQYWFTQRWWLKGGIGFSTLAYAYDDGDSQAIDEGVAYLFAVGVELVHSQTFGLDLHFKSAAGSYELIDTNITTNVLALGLNWY